MSAPNARARLRGQAIRTLTSPTAVTIHSVFDSQGRRIAEYNQASGALIREYVWNGWDPVAVIEGGVISFVRADHIGRPVFATNASGVKVWTATYTPFGGVHTSTGALPSTASPASGSKAKAASTRTGCATTTRRRGDIWKPTRWGWWMER